MHLARFDPRNRSVFPIFIVGTDGVEPDFVSAQNSDTVLILKSSGNIKLSISASVRFIKAPLPTFFWIEAVPTATKLSFTIELPSVAGVKTRDCHW